MIRSKKKKRSEKNKRSNNNSIIEPGRGDEGDLNTYGLAGGELLDGESLEIVNRSIDVADGVSTRDVSEVLDSVKRHGLVTGIVHNRDRVRNLISFNKIHHS